MEMPSLPDISAFAAPVYVVFILIEIAAILVLRKAGQYETKDTTTSILMGAGSIISTIILGGSVGAAIFAVYATVYEHRAFNIPFSWWSIVLCFVLDDLVFYWSHRWQHQIRWGWASHVIHHSSQHFNLSTALRQPWFSAVTGFFVLSIPLVALGFHPAMIAFAGSLNLFYQFFVHTEAVDRLHPWVEAVMNTPSHHRVHHGKNPRYLDANYAGVFIIWDRMFGTFVVEDVTEPVRYGLVRDIGTFNPLRVASHEYVAIGRDVMRRELSMKQRLAYVFAQPGWSHDGKRMTSQEIKRHAERVAARHDDLREGTKRSEP